MGKIVKYCAICEESFADKFSFCPNCAALLTAYEMNPIEIGIAEKLEKIEEPQLEIINDELVIENKDETNMGNEIYHITFVEGKVNKTRQTLLFGAFLFVMGGAVLALVLSIYNADIYVAALDDNLNSLVYAPIDIPTKLEPEPITENDKKKGGGGNGGNDDPNPASKGDYANQSEKPLIAPSVTNFRVTNPDIKIRMETEGKIKRNQTDNPYGVPTSAYDVPSDGPGKNGGQGNGPDRGQGPGRGPGSGPGDGPGIGPGPGGIDGKLKPKPPVEEEPPPLGGITVGLKIISKPRAIYTDAARRNQVAGTVTLRVTFNANGTIGNIVAISGLPDGLTEQAIVAARSIQFEPAKRNGVATTVSKQVQYTFTLY